MAMKEFEIQSFLHISNVIYYRHSVITLRTVPTNTEVFLCGL